MKMLVARSSAEDPDLKLFDSLKVAVAGKSGIGESVKRTDSQR